VDIEDLNEGRYWIDAFITELKAGEVRPVVLERLGQMLETAINEIDGLPDDSTQKTKKTGRILAQALGFSKSKGRPAKPRPLRDMSILYFYIEAVIDGTKKGSAEAATAKQFNKSQESVHALVQKHRMFVDYWILYGVDF